MIITKKRIVRSQDEEFKQILESHGWEFGSPSYTQVPEPKPEYVSGNTHCVEGLRKHLLDRIVIRDQFGHDHKARREFRLDMIKVDERIWAWINMRSKLRANNCIRVCDYMDIIIGDLKEVPQVHANLSLVVNPDGQFNGPKYHIMTVDERVEYVKRLDSTIFSFLEVLSK